MYLLLESNGFQAKYFVSVLLEIQFNAIYNIFSKNYSKGVFLMDLGVENEEIKNYLKILSKEIPDFLIEYANVPEMQRLKGISMVSACEHTKLIPYKFFHTRYEHSLGVALIVWNFTEDKKQTIAGLYHDIATPSFSHVVDYLHGDYEKQESTEELTEMVIKESKEIMDLLKRDNIALEEIVNYHIYPIADNNSPRLAADRLEYTLSDGLVTQDAFSIESIDRIYNDLTVLKNEEKEDEIGFKSLDIAEEYLQRASIMWHLFSGNSENNMIMQFWTDILKKMAEEEYITEKDLYEYSEEEIVDKIKNCPNEKIRKAFKIFSNSTEVGRSDIEVKDKYCISIKAKKRYTNPLVIDKEGTVKRISDISEKAKMIIEDIKKFEDSKYAYLNLAM